MCPQQQRQVLNSVLLTSLSVGSYNPVIDQFFMPLAHRPFAYEELRSKFFFLGKFDILSPDDVSAMSFFSLLTIRMTSSIMWKTPLIL